MIGQQERIIVERAAQELEDGMLVNLGIGLPTLIPSVLPLGLEVSFHSENGFVGMGAPIAGGTPNHDVIDAGGTACELVSGAACFDSLTSFALVRAGKLDMAVLGAFEVSLAGDLANWMIPGRLTPGMGGAMELAQKARRVVVLSRHTDKRGRGKLVQRCKLPLTARSCVDTLITDRALFRLREGQLTLTSVYPGETVEAVLAPLELERLPVADTLELWPVDSEGRSAQQERDHG
jgi:3-oxoacid CoA-transferase B subunit